MLTSRESSWTKNLKLTNLLQNTIPQSFMNDNSALFYVVPWYRMGD